MNIQRRNNRFVSECLHCAIAEQDVGPVLPRTMNQPLPAPSDTPSRTGQVTVADAMVQRLEVKGFRHAVEHMVVQGGHGEPLDEFPKMEAFLDTHFKQACR